MNIPQKITSITSLLAVAAALFAAAPASANIYSPPADTLFKTVSNPIIMHKYTADPAALVHDGKVYLYAGHDEAPAGRKGYVMN